jgi:hypothetical protein
VAAEHAFYFSGNESTELADALRTWLESFRRGQHPKPRSSSPPTWQQSTEQLLQVAVEGALYKHWQPPRTLRPSAQIAAAEHRTDSIAAESRTGKELANPPPN